MTVSSNQFQLHNHLLRHGMLNWVTRGVYLGTQRNYFMMHIDDIFLPDAKWDPVTNITPGDASVPTCALAGASRAAPRCGWCRATYGRDRLAERQRHPVRVPVQRGGARTERAPIRDDDVCSRTRRSSGGSTTRSPTLSSIPCHRSPPRARSPTTSRSPTPTPRSPTSTRRRSSPASTRASAPTCPRRSASANPSVVTAFNNTGIQLGRRRQLGEAQPARRRTGLTVPRYPSNVYYNVETRARPARRVQLDLQACSIRP